MFTSVPGRLTLAAQAFMVPQEWQVLVVEDEVDIRHMLDQLLRVSFGCPVILAADGPSGVEAARQGCPELVLLDLHLASSPHMDGFEVARQIRSSLPPERTLIFAVSNFAWDEQHVRRAVAAGCNGCLDKNRLTTDLKSTLSAAVRNALFERAARPESPDDFAEK
jgi:CheY-like chemotaxis protein